jgi:NADH dehydrogenase
VPGDGENLLQPLWVEDLATCLTWSLDDDETRNQVFEVGGPEYLSFNQVIQVIVDELQIERRLVHIRPPYLRAVTVFLENLVRRTPVSVYWLDYLATNRTCALDSVPRTFNLMPARLSQRLAYLAGRNWRVELVRSVFGRASWF